MSHRIETDWDSLDKDCRKSTARSFQDAVEVIDAEFGRGYAKKHPDLIGAFMAASAQHQRGVNATVGAQFIADAITGGLAALQFGASS